MKGVPNKNTKGLKGLIHKVAPKQLKVAAKLSINTQMETGKRMGITKGNSQ
jgi:hypothetical protein